MLLMDDRQNKGLPPNLAGWPTLPDEHRFLHHGLKGLHQSVSALTSEIMAKALPNSIFSRSSESHNQDKVSLGMSAAVQCHDMLEQMFNLTAMVMICLAQALDLRKVTLAGEPAKGLYELIRKDVPFVSKDIALSQPIQTFVSELKRLSLEKGEKIIKV